MSAQADRDRLVAAFLDLTLDQWRSWLQGMSDDDCLVLERSGVDQLAGQVVQALMDQRAVRSERARAAYLQAMAAMADETMRDLVRCVSGRDPLGVL